MQSDIDFARMIAGLDSDDATSQLGIIVKNPDEHENFIEEWQKHISYKRWCFSILATNYA